MLVATPCHAGDIHALQNLLQWITKLGVNKSHSCLIAADADTPVDEVEFARDLAMESFGNVEVITNGTTVKGWPAGPWSLFQAIINHVREPFLILESDAIPLKPGWLDEITVAYMTCGKPFMGHIYTCEHPAMMGQYMSGIAVYPADTKDRFPKSAMPVHWDVHGAGVMVPNGADTKLIRHVFGQIGAPPRINAGKKGYEIPPDCVLFHRDKNQTLIRIQARKLFPDEFKLPLIHVVFPVHNGDIQQAVKHAQWLVKLCAGQKWPNHATITHDPTCNVMLLNQLQALLNQCFAKVDTYVYPKPPVPRYPAAANFAWQMSATHMAQQGAPWFWLEADSAVLKQNWLEVLQKEYENCGRTWMGSVVSGMGHVQGTAVYPHNAALIMHKAMSSPPHEAFDMVAKADMGADVHDCSHLLFHVWSLIRVGNNRREPCPVGGGEIPARITPEELQSWVPRTAVYFHRTKCNSVVDALISGRYRP